MTRHKVKAMDAHSVHHHSTSTDMRTTKIHTQMNTDCDRSAVSSPSRRLHEVVGMANCQSPLCAADAAKEVALCVADVT